MYRVLDEARDSTLALKVLEHPDPKQLTSFEREYHTLASLRHPSVIEVYDYGRTDDGKPYYTMELLPGEDLLALAPLPFEEACVHLCDVATSLSLLHARGLLHRDVSPRNVRLDSQGRAKLLDFGALTGFGTASDIVGTPPCMSPEALEGLDLDPRSDLFSLGAIAYYTLTRRMPYAGRSVDDVRATQRVAPTPPAELVHGLPAALNTLVLQLLSLDPQSRPSSAAEVIDRLSGLSNLERGAAPPLTEIYLRSPVLIGRARECRQLKRHLARGVRGSGGVLLLEAASGMGRTRLCAEFCIEARLRGLSAVRVDAVQHPGPGGVVRALARALIEAVPDLARRALAGRVSGADELIKDPTARFEAIQDGTERLSRTATPREARLEDALAHLVTEIVAQRPLAIVVDDAHTLDASSARALAHLAHKARSARLVLLLTTTDEESPLALQPIRRIATHMRLRALSSTEIDELVDSVFGNVPHRARLSQWLLGVGCGNPGHSLELLRALVDRQMVRYAGGTWVLPQEFPEQDLPRSIEETIAARLAVLDPIERVLLRSLALYRGTMPLATCIELLPGEPPEQILRAIERLLTQDLLIRSEDGVHFGRHARRDLVLNPLSHEARRELHRGLSDALLATCAFLKQAMAQRSFQAVPTHAVLTALGIGFHLQCSGRSSLGTALMRDAAAELTLRGEGLADAVPTLEASVAEHAAAGREEMERAPLLAPLTLAGTYADYRLSYRYGEATIALLLDATGLARASRLRPFIGGRLALVLSLSLAFVRFKFTRRSQLARSFREMILGLLGISTGLLGTYSVLMDKGRARALAEHLVILRDFPRGHPLRLIQELQSALVAAACGDSEGTSRLALDVFAQLQNDRIRRAVPPEALVQWQVGCLTPSSLADSQRLDGRGQVHCAELDRIASAVSRQIAAGSRAAYHGHRGERAKFNQYRDEMDMLASSAGSTWREDVGTPRQIWSTAALCEDILELKRCGHALDVVAEEVESMRSTRDAARACYLAERGKAAEALATYGAMFEAEASDRSLLGARFAGAYARILRLAGDPQRAKDVCERALSPLDARQLAYALSVLGAQLELSLATALLGQPTQALQQLDALATLQGEHDNPLVHGLIHKARAQIALWRGDATLFAEQLRHMERWFRKTDNPALIAQCQRLSKEARSQGMSEALSVCGAGADPTKDREDFATAFHACKGARQKLQLAVDVALSEAGAERAYLYLSSATGLRFAAPMEGSEPPESVLAELTEQIEQLRRAELHPSVPPLITTLSEENAQSQDTFETFVPCLLFYRQDSTTHVVGAMALLPGALPLVPLEPALIESMARALHGAQDVRDIYVADAEVGQTVVERHPSGARTTA